MIYTEHNPWFHGLSFTGLHVRHAQIALRLVFTEWVESLWFEVLKPDHPTIHFSEDNSDRLPTSVKRHSSHPSSLDRARASRGWIGRRTIVVGQGAPLNLENWGHQSQGVLCAITNKCCIINASASFQQKRSHLSLNHQYRVQPSQIRLLHFKALALHGRALSSLSLMTRHYRPSVRAKPPVGLEPTTCAPRSTLALQFSWVPCIENEGLDLCYRLPSEASGVMCR